MKTRDEGNAKQARRMRPPEADADHCWICDDPIDDLEQGTAEEERAYRLGVCVDDLDDAGA